MSEASKPNDVFIHRPLPYIVVLRGAVSDDHPPSRIERRVVAYSVFEAMMQALLEAAGVAPDSTKWQVDSIGPDLPAYLMQALEQVLKEEA